MQKRTSTFKGRKLTLVEIKLVEIISSKKIILLKKINK